MGGRMSALSLPVEQRSRVEFRSYARRTPVLTLNSGRVLISLTLPERLSAAHVQFARQMAEGVPAAAGDPHHGGR